MTGYCNEKRLSHGRLNYRFHKSWLSGFAIPPNFLSQAAVLHLFNPLTLPSTPPPSSLAGEKLPQSWEGMKVPGLCGLQKTEQRCDTNPKPSLHCSVPNSTPPSCMLRSLLSLSVVNWECSFLFFFQIQAKPKISVVLTVQGKGRPNRQQLAWESKGLSN